MTRVVSEGCAEGQSPFAEGLGVSPNFPIIPQEWGQGVESSGSRFIEVYNWECRIMSGERR
jgi:hypothetical protein